MNTSPHPSASSIATSVNPKLKPPKGGTPNTLQSAPGVPQSAVAGSEIILLAVTGMSPAVLTETLWALAQENPPVIPHRIVVITTLSGRQAIERELLAPRAEWGGKSVWEGLREAIATSAQFPNPKSEIERRLILHDIRVIEAPNPRTGRTDGLDDLRTGAENEAAADFILEEVRRIVENPDTHLIASLAGGRKTMGALLYACLTLLGRETDRLTHVLVNEPFDNPGLSPRFYYPVAPPLLHQLTGRSGKVLSEHSTSGARLQLADVPFVPLRNLFTRQLATKPGTFTALVARCRQHLAQMIRHDLQLTVHQAHPHLQVNRVQITLSPLQHLLALFLAQSASRGDPPFAKYDSALEPLKQFGERLHAERQPDDFADWRYGARLPKDFDGQRLRKLLDELKNKLRRGGAETARLISLLPAKGRFSLDLPPSTITIQD